MIQQQPGNNTEGWAEALKALQQGKSVGFPTETVWGLGVCAHIEAAVKHLSDLKKRDSTKALQVSCLDIEQAKRLVLPEQVMLERLYRLLPGPLTLVAWASSACPAWLQFEGKVGLRVPDHPTIRELLRRFGEPLATSSLNTAGQPPARTYQEARAYGLAAVLLDAYGPNDPENSHAAPSIGLPSTVVDCTTGQILRQGAVSAAHIKAALEQP